MPTEVERKFRVLSYDPSRLTGGDYIRQGYLCHDPAVRVRLRGENAWLTIKGPGLSERAEFEYPIPVADAEQLLALCADVLEKTRYVVGPLEIDVFGGALACLVLAEAEGVRLDEPLDPPDWLTWVEVTGRPEYTNSHLVRYGIPKEQA
jgi:adenylate cyclase